MASEPHVAIGSSEEAVGAEAPWIESATRALSMAARALDPNDAGGRDLVLARVLLGHALASLAGASGVPSVDDAVACFERTGVLARARIEPVRARASLACLDGARERVASEDLVGAEIVLAALLRGARGRTGTPPALVWTRRGLVLAGAAAVAAAVVPMLGSGHGPWEAYRWTASSSAFGYGSTGLLGQHGAFGLLFHTALEEHPWVVVDLLATRTVRRVTVVNRSDCCDERCLPLVVGVDGGNGTFTEVARRVEAFGTWTAEFPARATRNICLWVEARTYFHLQEIQIR